MSADGRVMYYAGHGLSGACKTHNMPPWACCAGTRIQAVADYDDLIFFKDADSLYVNIFTPATVAWDHGKTRVTLRQETRFPESDEVVMRLSLAAGGQVRPQAASARLAGGTDGSEGERPGCER